MRELFELIAEHPIVSLFLVTCIGWLVDRIIELVKPCKQKRDEQDPKV